MQFFKPLLLLAVATIVQAVPNPNPVIKGEPNRVALIKPRQTVPINPGGPATCYPRCCRKNGSNGSICKDDTPVPPATTGPLDTYPNQLNQQQCYGYNTIFYKAYYHCCISYDCSDEPGLATPIILAP